MLRVMPKVTQEVMLALNGRGRKRRKGSCQVSPKSISLKKMFRDMLSSRGFSCLVEGDDGSYWQKW